jgi:DNA-directed RNA polymerase specialized sigma24 family protein
MNLETALERTAPTRAEWRAWTQRELPLAGCAYAEVRAELRSASPDRQDEVLGAVVRVVQTERAAFGVLAVALLPGLRRRVGRYSRCLDRQDAFALMVVALYEAAIGYDTRANPRFVATRLLALPTRRLRHEAARQRAWRSHACDGMDVVGSGSVADLSVAAILTTAVDAGVLATRDAHLIHATRVNGLPLREAARRQGLSYEAAKKRRQRAEARWIMWWLQDIPGEPGTGRRGAA